MTAPATLLRWGTRHGLPRLAMNRSARRGDPIAGLFRDPMRRADPHREYDDLRARGPLLPGGFGLVTARHAVVESVLTSADFGVGFDLDRAPRAVRWVLRAGDSLASSGVVDPPSMLAVDPPDHTRYRRLTARSFTPRVISASEDQVQRLADRLLDDLCLDTGTVDLVSRYAALLPVIVIAELLGVPVSRRADFLLWGEAAAATLDAGLPWSRYRKAEQALGAMHTFLAEHLAQLRRDPGEDLVSQLVNLSGEEALTDRELHAIVLLLLGAGFETTVNLLGNAVVLLDQKPEQRQALRSGAASWDLAVEEALRYDCPVQVTARQARTDTEIAGVAVRRGTFVTLLIGAANRDPDVFADPHHFDIGRQNARAHLAFSAGIHYCLGAGLARLEGIVGLRTLAERFPEMRVAGTPQRRDLRTLRGFATLPVSTGRPAA